MLFLEKNLGTVIALKADIDWLQIVKRTMMVIPFDLWSPTKATDSLSGTEEEHPEMTAMVLNFDAEVLRNVARDAIVKEIERRISDCREAMRSFGVTLEGEEPKEEKKPKLKKRDNLPSKGARLPPRQA